MATIYDVARAAGVSISTVSHVLNSTRFVSEETKAKVQQAIEALNYRPSSLARALVRQETRSIGLIVPDNVNPFFAELAYAIENYGFSAGYHVILCNAGRNTAKELAYLDMLIAKRVDGVIYMTTDMAADRLQPFHNHKIPVVTFDRDYPNVDGVLINNFQGGYNATRHLLELGHRCIACISGPNGPAPSQDRVRGYRAALQEYGVKPEANWVLYGDWSYQAGRELVQRLLALSPRPTALFACNDTMAIGVISYLNEQRMHVPDNLSIVGFDNIALSAFIYPPLTTIMTPALEAGQQLCQMLFNRINNCAPAAAQRFTLSSNLLIRQSTGAYHKGD